MAVPPIVGMQIVVGYLLEVKIDNGLNWNLMFLNNVLLAIERKPRAIIARGFYHYVAD